MSPSHFGTSCQINISALAERTGVSEPQYSTETLSTLHDNGPSRSKLGARPRWWRALPPSSVLRSWHLLGIGPILASASNASAIFNNSHRTQLIRYPGLSLPATYEPIRTVPRQPSRHIGPLSLTRLKGLRPPQTPAQPQWVTLASAM